MSQISIWVKPGSSRDAIGWDPWRKRWVVTCRAPPSEGAANRVVALLVAGWLGVPPASVRWVKAGSSHAKVLSVDGVSAEEVRRRLALVTSGLRVSGAPTSP
jgi:uncharacterized protein YggU (UPF0235/DUF167 family)